MIDYELLQSQVKALGITIDEYAPDRFDTYADFLVRWNEKMNLTAITQPDEIVIKHFIDCLEILKYVDISPKSKIIDVGSGAGFPGVPLLFAMPKLQLTVVDSLHKRLIFIKELLKSCGLMADRVHQRAEELGRNPEYREQFDFAFARAVAPLNVLSEYCLPFVKVGGEFVAMKGSEDETEIGANAIKLLGGEIIDNVSYKLPSGDNRHIIVVKKISQTPTKYPRRTKKIDTKPL